MQYKTIAERCETRFIEKKSEFIGYICPVSSESEATAFIEEIRALHRRATHNCYAYILRENNTARHSDDGEPGGTAGMPIYEVLRKEGLTDVCCVVTRYFGGIQLGAGGLVRAYTRSAKDAVDAAQIKCMADALRMTLTVDYSLYGRLAQIFAEFDARTESEEFADSVSISLYIRDESAEGFTKRLTDACGGNITVKTDGIISYDFAVK